MMLFRRKISDTGGTAPAFTQAPVNDDRDMRRKKRYGLACLILASVMITIHAASVSSAQTAAGDVKADDVYATDFVFKDLSGKDVKLSEFKGRPVFLIFMTTWCRDCFASISSLKAIYKKYHEKGLVMLSINIQEPQAKVAAYVQKNGLPYPMLLDPDGSASRRFGVGGVPVKALIDRKGRIICWNCRSLEELLENQFEMRAK
ncbi:MAG: TlpA family protein disulfide reductase [Deltaproteobacteria bacterium]